MAEYDSLHGLLEAARAGDVTVAVVEVDNDGVWAYGPFNADDEWAEPELLFSGEGPETELVNLLNDLGLPARRP